MADKEISELTAAAALTGAELVHVDQGGNSRKATLLDIAGLATGAMLVSVYDPDTNGIIAVAQGGTNASTASGARTNLGLGTMAVQGAGAVAITGGSVTGITDLTVADGGTGGSDASTARTNLGLAIGTDVQAYSANLAGFAATTVANVQNRDNHHGTQLAATISDFSTAADLRIAAAVGVSVQAYDALLSSVSSLSLTAGDIIYATGPDAVASLPVGAAGQVLAVNGSGEPAWDTSLVVGGLIAANNLSDVADVAQARENLAVAPYVATRTALKALDTTKDTVVRLTESGREGVFKWTLGDFSTHIAADTQEGIYVKATAIAATVGAWVRETPNSAWHTDWFAIPADDVAGTGSVKCHTEFNAMMALGNIVKPAKIKCAAQIFSFGAAPTKPLWICEWAGTVGPQPTQFRKHYTESDTYRGILHFSDWGGYVHHINFSAAAGYGGGSLLASILTISSPAAGRLFVERCHFSGGDSVNYSVVCDGQTNVNVGGPGNRGIQMLSCEVFGAAVAAMRLISVQHCRWGNFYVATSGGSSAVALELTGISASASDDIVYNGVISGEITLDRLSRSDLYVNIVQANITNTANVASTRIHGSYTAGNLDHDWDEASCEYVFGRPYIDVAAAYLSASLTNQTGDGTEVVVICNTLPSAGSLPLGRAQSLNYDTTTGRYTARRAGYHSIAARVTLTNLAAGHTTGDIFIRAYTSGGSAIAGGVRQSRVSPAAIATGGQATLEICGNIHLDPGQYVEISVDIAGSTKTVSIGGSSTRLTTFEASL